MNCELNQTGKINEQNTAGRLEKQMRFILEIDKLKQVLRRSYIGDGVKEKAEREGITARKLFSLRLLPLGSAPTAGVHCR